MYLQTGFVVRTLPRMTGDSKPTNQRFDIVVGGVKDLPLYTGVIVHHQSSSKCREYVSFSRYVLRLDRGTRRSRQCQATLTEIVTPDPQRKAKTHAKCSLALLLDSEFSKGIKGTSSHYDGCGLN